MALPYRIDHGPGRLVAGPDSRATGFEDHMGRCLSRVYFMDSRNHRQRLECLFNPDDLNIDKEAEWGELNPIGWSSTTQQYAFTRSPRFPVNLVFSRVAMLQLGQVYKNFREAEYFFNSFLHGSFAGRAPRFLLLVWPRTVNIVCTVRRVGTGYKRWSQKGVLMEYGISLDLVEIRQSWLGSPDVSVGGAYLAPDGSVTSQGAYDALTGKPTNMSGGGGSGG